MRKRIKTAIVFLINVLNLGKGISKRIGKLKKKYRFDANFVFSNFSSWGEKHNSAFYKLLEYSEGKKNVFDIGAHIGLCALPLSDTVGQGGVVYAFEPGTANLKFLKKNIELNGITNISVIDEVVGDGVNPSIPFYEIASVSGMNSIVNYRNSLNMEKVLKKQISLDYFCEQNNIIPDIVKIDVEGAELNVLRGGGKTFKQFKPIIFLSVHPRHLEMQGINTETLLNFINELNYKIFAADDLQVNKLSFAEYYLLPGN